MIIEILLIIILFFLLKKLFISINNEEEFNNKENAYITLVTNDLYVPGVLALGNSMNKLNLKYKKICLYKNINDDSINKIKKEKFELISIEELNNKNIKLNIKLDKYKYNIKRFKEAFNKLYIWSLIEYNKLVYLDCDMIVYKNIDNLFKKPTLSAVQGRPMFNSGLLVIKPSMKIFNDLNKLINDPNKWIKNKRDLLGKSINDQALLGYYFKDYNKLSRKYNVTKNYHSKIKDIYIKHWNLKEKPWFYSCKSEKSSKEWCKFYNY